MLGLSARPEADSFWRRARSCPGKSSARPGAGPVRPTRGGLVLEEGARGGLAATSGYLHTSGMAELHATQVQTIDGATTTLEAFDGKVLLIVNTASQCGFTPQFAELEELYRRYRDRGFAVLGFPCNQFGGQDPGTNDEIASFCQSKYDVTFPMFAKSEVNGSGAHPLFRHLTKTAPGLMGSERIKWNFTKFLVDRNGDVVKRYAPTTKPSKIAPDIEALL